MDGAPSREVIDVNKGIQTQTAECLVVGEITTSNLLVVLNKTDMIPEESRAEKVEKMKKRLANTFKATKFKDCEMIPLAARPGGADTMVRGEDERESGNREEGRDPVSRAHAHTQLCVCRTR